MVSIGLLVSLAVLLYLLICFGWGTLRGVVKARVRVIMIAASALVAVVACIIMRNSLPSTSETLALLETQVLPMIQDANTGEIMGYLELSPTLLELVLQLAAGLVLPLVCLVLFLTLSFLTWLAYLIVVMIRGKAMKQKSKEKKLGRLRGGVWGLVRGMIAVLIVMVPLCGYVDLAAPTMNNLANEGVIDASDPTMQMVMQEVDGLKKSPALSVSRVLGADLINNALMKIRIDGQNFRAEDELDSLVVLWTHISDLGGSEISEYGPEEAAVIRAIADSFADSKLLAPIMGDVIYAATEAWMNDQAFLGVEKPEMGELFDPFMDELWFILHGDAKNSAALQADVRTVASLIATLAENGVFANLENTDALLASLSGGTVVKDMVSALGSNTSMKRLIPQITNLGIRAVGQTLQIPENPQAVYDTFLSKVATSLNEVSSMDAAARIAALTPQLDSAFDNAGIVVEDDILDFYSSSLIHDLIDNNPNGTVTSADVQAFFVLYADRAVAREELSGKDTTVALGEVRSEDPLAGSIYANMTREELEKCAATVLAKVCYELAAITTDTENVAEVAKQIATEAFSEIMEEGSAAMEAIQNVVIEQPLSAETVTNTASLQSSTEMNSTVVTLDDLLLDITEAAETITEETIEKEAEAISSIFEAAGTILGDMTGEGGSMEGMDLGAIAGSVGNILDSLSQTSTFGEDKTAGLLTAVLQSETVRNSAQLDMETATNLANQATSNGGNYSETMGVVAGSVGIMDALNKGEPLTEEKVIELIQTLNPQTAGMIEVYITENRLIGFGLPEEYAGIVAKFITSLFHYMGNEDLENYEGEAKALNQILSIALAAKDADENKLFSSEGQDDGVLPTAKETVETLLNAHAIDYALIQAMTDGEKVIAYDPFQIAQYIPEDSQEYQDCLAAIYEYRETHDDVSDLALQALAAIFGVTLELN